MTDEIVNPSVQFDEIAFLYDELMESVPYQEWINYLDRILDTFNTKPHNILDLCCGTGRVSMLLADQGYHMSGVDISSGMIELARKKSKSKKYNITFEVQDASCLKLPERFDLVISLFDSLNYILDINDLQRCFYRVADHLEPGGLFIFDMNTELAFLEGLFDQRSTGSRSHVLYNWKGSYDQDARLCAIDMDFTYKSDADRHVHIVHYQRAYDIADIVGMLGASGLEVLAVYDAYTFRRAGAKSDRAFFVARK
ncbi:MAG: class I SAM-dependent DNA methyltransferase [Armatimonadota bacterium]